MNSHTSRAYSLSTTLSDGVDYSKQIRLPIKQIEGGLRIIFVFNNLFENRNFLFLFPVYKSSVSDLIPFVVLRNTAVADIIFVRRYAVKTLEQQRTGRRKRVQGIKVL